MGVAADRASTAQGRCAECGGEAAVGRAARGLARDPEPQTGGGSVVKLEQLVARLVLLERQEIAFSQNARVAPRQFATAADLAHLAEDLFHDVEGRKTDIDRGGGTCGDRVDRGPALGEPDIDGGAEVVIGQPVEPLDLPSHCLNRADPLGMRGTRVSRTPGHLQFDKGGTLAARDEVAARAARLGVEHRTCSLCFGLGREDGEAISSSEV